MLRSEAGIELIIEDDVRPEKQKRKPGVSDLRTLIAGGSWPRRSALRAGGPVKCLTQGVHLSGPWPLPWVLLHFE